MFPTFKVTFTTFYPFTTSASEDLPGASETALAAYKLGTERSLELGFGGEIPSFKEQLS